MIGRHTFASMLFRIAPIAATWLVSVGLPAADAQWLPRSPIPRNAYVGVVAEPRWSVDTDGAIRFDVVPVLRFHAPLDVMLMLQSEAVQDALNIGQAQRARIPRFVAILQRNADLCQSQWGTIGLTEQSIQREFSSPAEEAQAFLREAISPDRQPRLAQIVAQYEIARIGLLASLIHGSLSRPVRISRDQERELIQTYFAELEAAQAEIDELKHEAIEKLWKPLTPTQKEKIEERFDIHADLVGQPLWLQLARFSPGVVQDLQRRLATTEVVWKQYALLGFGATCDLRLDASIQFDLPANDPVRADDASFVAMLEFLSNEKTQTTLQLPSKQTAAVEKAAKAWQQMLREYAAELRAGNNPEANVHRKWKSVIESFRDNHFQQLQDALDEDQQDRLLQSVQRVGILRAGPTFALGYGDVAKWLSIGVDQKKELEFIASAARAALREKMKGIEARLQRRLIDLLTDQQNDALVKIVGKPIDVFQGHFELHAEIMRDTDRAKDNVEALLDNARIRLAPLAGLPR